MAFERLQKLGDARFTKIRNELIRGTPAMSLARTIQMEWQEFQDVGEKTLTQQLNRLRLAIQEGAFGKEVSEELEEAPQHKRINILGKEGALNPLEELEDLAKLQRRRIIRLSEKEQNMPLPIGGLNDIIKDQAKLLLDIQKVRFDLGLDEFQGIVPGFKGVAANVTMPDGTHIHKEVYEAVGIAESILASRGITGA